MIAAGQGGFKHAGEINSAERSSNPNNARCQNIHATRRAPHFEKAKDRTRTDISLRNAARRDVSSWPKRSSEGLINADRFQGRTVLTSGMFICVCWHCSRSVNRAKTMSR